LLLALPSPRRKTYAASLLFSVLKKAFRAMDLDLLRLDVYREIFRVPKGQTIVELESFCDVQVGRKLALFLTCKRNGRDFEIRAIYNVRSGGLEEYYFDLSNWKELHSETPKKSERACLTAKHRRHARIMLVTVVDFIIGTPRLTPEMKRMIVSWIKWNWENRL